jgi:hypothetical protein
VVGRYGRRVCPADGGTYGVAVRKRNCHPVNPSIGSLWITGSVRRQMPYQRTSASGRLAILLIFHVGRGGCRRNESYDGGFDVGSSGPRMKSFAHPEFSQFVKLSQRADQNWAIGATNAQKIVALPHPVIIPDLVLRRSGRSSSPARLPERREAALFATDDFQEQCLRIRAPAPGESDASQPARHDQKRRSEGIHSLVQAKATLSDDRRAIR